jgi:soluble lytic murein transglycosylase-like protein
MPKKLFWLVAIILIIYIYLNWPESEVHYLRPAGEIGQEITYEVMFQEIAAIYDLDWRLLALHAYRESSLEPQAQGAANDMGLMQIIPSTWAEWAPRVGVTDPYDPYSNVLVGAAYLAYWRDYFEAKGYADRQWMLLAYNWGPYNLDQFLASGGDWNQIPEPQRLYVLDILQNNPAASFTWTEVQAKLSSKRSIRR